jgi:hypothetical protein
MSIRTAWGDYFTGSPTLIEQKEYGETQTPSATNVYVSNCLFRTITSGSNGGALSCRSSISCLLIESSSFFSCKASNNGGAIYFVNTNSGECVLHELCGYDCGSTSTGNSNGLFCYINVKDTASTKNYINYSSISHCGNDNSKPQHPLWYNYGKNCCPSINISMNKCYGRSAIFCYPYYDSNSVTCSLTYSTITDNNSTYTICILFNRGSAKYEIKSCNILRNTQDRLNYEGIIFTAGNLFIADSCILENRANYILYAGSSYYTITLSNCTVDSISSNVNINIQSTVTKSFILALNHISTRNCHSGYDSAGTLTPIIPPLSCSNHPIHYITCKKFLLQLEQRDIVSLLSILIFNFIHSYTSI